MDKKGAQRSFEADNEREQRHIRSKKDGEHT